MSIRAFTDDPAGLLSRIKQLIKAKHVDTWRYDSAGDFTHTPDQWDGKAWLRPEVLEDTLRFIIVRTKGVPLTREIFAIYHGRFIEMLTSHVPDNYKHASATPNPAKGEPQIED